MIIYSPDRIIPERIKEAEKILNKLPYMYCFITGSFLYKEKFKDIDVFVITRSKKRIDADKKIKISTIDFNSLHSLFYHSISKMCVAKEILPKKALRVTVADYWSIINEAVPAILNGRTSFYKEIRSLILYTEFLINCKILDSYELGERILGLKNYEEALTYIKKNAPMAVRKNVNSGYIKRFFYTQSGFYKRNFEYYGQKVLYEIAHAVTQGA